MKIKDVKRKMEKSIFFIFDCIDFLEYLLKFLKFLNILVDLDDLKLKYILIFYRVKENMVKIFEYLFSEIIVILIVDIFENVK